MSKLRKVITLLVLLSIIITACGPSGEGVSPGFQAGGSDFHTPTEAPTDEPEAMMAVGVDMAALNGVEVEFWHVWDGGPGEALQGIIDDFNATNEYGITVIGVEQGSYGDVSTAMSAALNTGETPDLVVQYRDTYLGWQSAADAVVDMTPYLDDPMVGYSADEIAEFTPAYWSVDQVGDQRLGMPFSKSAQFIFYNNTWAQELGFDAPPSTPAEFKEQACASVAANGDGTGGWFIHTGADTIASWIFAFGGEFESADGYSFNTPEALAAFEFMADLYTSGCAWKPEANYPNAEFATRQGLFYTSSSGGVGYQESANEEAGSTDEWSLIPYPTLEGGGALVSYGPSAIMIQSTPEEQLAAWLFLKFFSEAENQVPWIEATGYYSPRATTIDLLTDYNESHPFYRAGYETVVASARITSQHESAWAVRGAMQDAGALLFQDGFDPTTIPQILEDLDATAAELHAESLE
ncbi:MAG: extracellular solute-binding protein [Anaerolineae bacterium]|nr:extracellular solute-binding protein [Anaerolineae bacterium]